MERLLIGTAAGVIASFVMDGVTTLFMRTQSDSLEREQEARDVSQPVALAGRIGTLLGFNLSHRATELGGTILHRMTGIGASPLITAIALRRNRQVRDAVTAMLVIWLVFDEGTSWAIEPGQARSYPAATHLRGLVGHISYGLTIGVIARAATSQRSLQRAGNA